MAVVNGAAMGLRQTHLRLLALPSVRAPACVESGTSKRTQLAVSKRPTLVDEIVLASGGATPSTT
jgi:hypothetical protein